MQILEIIEGTQILQMIMVTKVVSIDVGQNAIALSKRRFVLNLKYAAKASVEINTASVIPPICKNMCAKWYPCNI